MIREGLSEEVAFVPISGEVATPGEEYSSQRSGLAKELACVRKREAAQVAGGSECGRDPNVLPQKGVKDAHLWAGQGFDFAGKTTGKSWQGFEHGSGII